jgi:hypothetical protein
MTDPLNVFVHDVLYDGQHFYVISMRFFVSTLTFANHAYVLSIVLVVVYPC